MRTQESGNAVGGQDAVQGRPVFWVRLKHLLEQILQLVGKATGEGRVRTPTHLKDQAPPAGRLELDTQRGRGEASRPAIILQQCFVISGCDLRGGSRNIAHKVSLTIFGAARRRKGKYRVSQGAELVENAAQRPHITAGHTNTERVIHPLQTLVTYRQGEEEKPHDETHHGFGHTLSFKCVSKRVAAAVRGWIVNPERKVLANMEIEERS